MITQRFVLPPEAFWKKIVRLGCNMFELGDHEYIKASYSLRWPLTFWITIIEPRRRRGWKRVMPWRVRCALAGLIRQLVWSRCTPLEPGGEVAEEMTTEQYAQRCFNLRGYMVAGTLTDYLRVGELTTLDDQPGTATETKAVVVAKTNRQDMVDQLIAMGERHCVKRITALHFYRLVAK